MNSKSYVDVINQKGYCIVNFDGVSMMPLLRKNLDTVYLEKINRPLKKYDVILFKRKDGKLVMHRIVGKDDNGFILLGDNQVIKEHNITNDMIIAVMKGFYRKERYIDSNNFLYKLYILIWQILYPFRYVVYFIKRIIKKIYKLF